jgi:predicted naringenin-chalcone synthase
MDGFQAMQIENTRDLITWRVGDFGFEMFLSTQVPIQIAKAMRENEAAVVGNTPIQLWAVHPGGRAIIDAVEDGLALSPETLSASRCVLSSYGNMSSATVMFVLQELLKTSSRGQNGCAISFGPGLTAEIMRFHVA